MGTGALVAVASHLALKIAPELVQASGDFAAFTEVVVVDQFSCAADLSHEAVWAEVVAPPIHFIAEKVVDIVGEVTLLLLVSVSGGNQYNCGM